MKISNKNIQCLKLCLVTHSKHQSIDLYKHTILKAARGGVTSIQIREKKSDISQLRDFALEIKSILKPFKISLIINDHVRLAKDIDADGVHLGQSDIHPIQAREILGPDKIIGLSIETLQELTIANQISCLDYVAASAVFKSKTKPNSKTLWGLTGLKQIVQRSVHPVVAIGGITLTNIEQIMELGTFGAAVVGAIHDAYDAQRAASDLIKKILAKREEKSLCLRK